MNILPHTNAYEWIDQEFAGKKTRVLEPNIGLTVTVAPNKGCLKTPGGSGLEAVFLSFSLNMFGCIVAGRLV